MQIARVAFKNTKTLNRIQSIVFETAYKTNENLLICAPTGAGKTNIAMLTILHELKQHISQGVIKKDEFKVSERVTCISGLCGPPTTFETKNLKILLTNFFLLVYKNNSISVKLFI